MTTRTDTFNRSTSSSTINSPSDGGGNWTATTSTWGISSAGTGDGNGGYRVNGSLEGIIWLEASAANVDVSVKPRLAMGTAGPVARYADSSNFLLAHWTASNIILYKRVAGSFTQLGSTYTATISVGDTIRLSAPASNNLVVYVNDVSRITATDSAGSSNTKVGFRMYNGAGSTMFDDFLATDLDSGGGGTNYFLHRPMLLSGVGA